MRGFQVLRLVGAFARILHSQISRSRIASTIYVYFWALVLRPLPAGRLKSLLVGTLESVAWPVGRFRAVRCRLFGSDRPLLFAPHPCFIDFMTLFHEHHDWEPELIDFLRPHLTKVDNVIEFGANVGFFTLFCSQQFAGRGFGHVYAFEPAPRVYQALLDNLTVNGVQNVTSLNAAISSDEGIAMFHEPTVAAFDDRRLLRSSLVRFHAHWGATDVREYPVFTIGPAMIEPLLRDGGRVLIKLDIELAEAAVLEALEELVVRYEPDILVEVLWDSCEALNALRYLSGRYRFFHLTDRGPIERKHFVSDTGADFNDYFLTARS